MSISAWLIEIAPPLGDVLYYCGPGDWCSNPNHAHKFTAKADAVTTLAGMQNPSSMRIAEHEWPDAVETHKPGCEKFKALWAGQLSDFPADVPCTCSQVSNKQENV